MGESIRFYLHRDPKGRDEKVIYCYIRLAEKTITLNTGERIIPEYWDIKKDEVDIDKAKKDKVKGITELRDLNTFLAEYKSNIKQIIRDLKTDALKGGEPFTFEVLKKAIDFKINPQKELDFYVIFKEFIDSRENKVSKATTIKFNSLKKHILEYSTTKNKKITFNTMNKGFFQDLESYFIEKEISNNTSIKYIQFLKRFLRWTVEREYTTTIKFEAFKTQKEIEADAIALTIQEIKLIETCKGLTESLQRVRDVFLFQFYTGQRYSDILKFDIADVKDGIWHLRQAKTKKVLNIPLFDSAIEILKKYNNKLPVITNQKMNEYLKEVGRLSGLTEIVKITRFIGSESITEEFKKYEQLTTHTARRSFTSVAAYGNVNQQIVKAMTGHGSDKMIARYFKSNGVETKKALQDIFSN